MKDFTLERVAQLQTMGPSGMRARPRMQASGCIFETSNFHIDRGNWSARLLDAVDCVGTYLAANDDTVHHPSGIDIKPEGPITLLETPRNSLTLITLVNHPHQAILHTEPFAFTADEPRSKRAVNAYDLVLH